MAAWWCGSYEGAPDVSILASRLQCGKESWEPAVILSEIPDRFEGNPVLFSVPDGRIWLFFSVVNSELPDMIQIMSHESSDNGYSWSPAREFLTPVGIRTRNYLIIMDNGEFLLPVFDQMHGQSIFFISDDFGKSWEFSDPIVSDPGNIQPTVKQLDNGNLYAFMRTWNDNPTKRYLWQSESADYGKTWSSPKYSKLPTVDSAIEMIKLHNGHVVLSFNDGKGRERTPLTLALSLDVGRTWPYKRNLESGVGSFSYPSLVQTRDGHIHVTYSFNRKFIKHVEVNEEWIRSGD